jgi:hypothetical protein
LFNPDATALSSKRPKRSGATFRMKLQWLALNGTSHSSTILRAEASSAVGNLVFQNQSLCRPFAILDRRHVQVDEHAEAQIEKCLLCCEQACLVRDRPSLRACLSKPAAPIAFAASRLVNMLKPLSTRPAEVA